MRTFREEANAVLGRARRLQFAGLAMMLGVVFFLPFYPWLMLVAVGGVVLQMAGHWKLRKLRCPGCGKDLRFLVYDPSYSGQFPGGVVAPKAFAPKVSGCGYCGRRFDEGREEAKDAQDGQDAQDRTGGTGAARQNGDGGGVCAPVSR